MGDVICEDYEYDDESLEGGMSEVEIGIAKGLMGVMPEDGVGCGKDRLLEDEGSSHGDSEQGLKIASPQNSVESLPGQSLPQDEEKGILNGFDGTRSFFWGRVTILMMIIVCSIIPIGIVVFFSVI